MSKTPKGTRKRTPKRKRNAKSHALVKKKSFDSIIGNDIERKKEIDLLIRRDIKCRKSRRRKSNNKTPDKVNVAQCHIPPIIKRIVNNDYATTGKPIPSTDILHYLSGSNNKVPVIVFNSKVLKYDQNFYVVAPTKKFVLNHNFEMDNNYIKGGKLLNIKITAENMCTVRDKRLSFLRKKDSPAVPVKSTNVEWNENVSNGLQSLNLLDVTHNNDNDASFISEQQPSNVPVVSAQNESGGHSSSNTPKIAANATTFETLGHQLGWCITANTTTIEIPDSPLHGANLDERCVMGHTDEAEISPSECSDAGDIVVLDDDDDDQSFSSDSDVIFVGNKRKSTSEIQVAAKRVKLDESVIVVDDSVIIVDDSTATSSKELRKKQRENKESEQKSDTIKTPVTTGNTYFTRSSSFSNGNNGLLADSTPKKNLIHSCAATPNLATIPEEVSNKTCKEKVRNVNTPYLLEQHVNNQHYVEPGLIRAHYNETNNNLIQRLSESMNEDTDDLGIYGGNFLNAGPVRTEGLRPIIIDGSNVALRHSNGKYFSVRGLKICIDYFLKKGHEVAAVVPMFRKKRTQNSDPALLRQLEDQGHIVFTPARTVNGRHIVPYDDRYIVLMAAVNKGIIVSSDNFRDLMAENPQLTEVIEKRVLNPTWVKDMIIFPLDPLGRNGPSLRNFLRFP